jgi:signal transduction histidine kinase
MLLNFKKIKLNLTTKFILFCGITLSTALGISFYIIAKQQERLIMERAIFEARALFKHIVLTRQWIADHQGVFVEKFPWVKENPYLKNIRNIDVMITDSKGKVFVRKNPAMITRELSEYAKEKGLFWFRITSLKLINPENTPDEFERRALYLFEQNSLNETMTVIDIENSKYFRYISPLYVEESCLVCHSQQGYRVGDIRGAISITIPIDKTFAQIYSNRKNMAIAYLLTLFSLNIVMIILMKRLILKPINKLKTSIEEFSGGIYNPNNASLKTRDEFEELSVSFSLMAKTLSEYHDCLNERIKSATKDLEEKNRKLIEINSLLKEVNIRKSDFIARASHELRTPLTSIKGAIDYINAKLSLSKSEQKQESLIFDEIGMFLDIIKNNSERLIRMVNDMLDLERIEMGKSEMQQVKVNPVYLIEETLTNFYCEAERRNIKLVTNLEPNLSVLIDEDRIKQVLTNLLANAFKFSPDNSEITVSAYSKDGFVVISVCDQGLGVPLSIQDRIFDKFFKYGNKEGSGLGLAICKSIIEAHGGGIYVKSNGEKGSCFYFELPIDGYTNKN